MFHFHLTQLKLFSLFIASSSQRNFPLLDHLFPRNSLDSAFERYPLLSTVSNESKIFQDGIPIISLSGDETVVLNDGKRELQKDLRQAQASELFQLSDLDKILHRPNLEYRIIKKIIRDGEEWTGEIPHDMIVNPALDVKRAFSRGFSLVINKLEKHWAAVSKFAREVEMETQLNQVTSNLYLTPPNASAFESHWDWMDVMVVQISGKKYWNVAKEPTVYLSNEKLKRKPTLEEMSAPHFSTFIMHPGDVLYIPRGFLHNASTIGLFEESSLHITFGIEATSTTVEHLMYHSLDQKFHGIVHEEALKSGYNLLRQSVPLFDSWKTVRNASKQFDDALDTMHSIAMQRKDSSLSKAFEEAMNKFEIALAKLTARANEQRNINWKMDDAILAG